MDIITNKVMIIIRYTSTEEETSTEMAEVEGAKVDFITSKIQVTKVDIINIWANFVDKQLWFCMSMKLASLSIKV